MFEKTSCYHPDKVADRIAGAVVDHCYTHAAGGWLKSNPRVAVETLIGHTEGLVIIETSEPLRVQDVTDIMRLPCVYSCHKEADGTLCYLLYDWDEQGQNVKAHEGQWLCEGYDGKWTVTDEPPAFLEN